MLSRYTSYALPPADRDRKNAPMQTCAPVAESFPTPPLTERSYLTEEQIRLWSGIPIACFEVRIQPVDATH